MYGRDTEIMNRSCWAKRYTVVPKKLVRTYSGVITEDLWFNHHEVTGNRRCCRKLYLYGISLWKQRKIHQNKTPTPTQSGCDFMSKISWCLYKNGVNDYIYIYMLSIVPLTIFLSFIVQHESVLVYFIFIWLLTC